ncbi:hypothetical protein CSC17_5316 [Klebsiella oxytoca]|uniref:hypothetical protein n=1 Tax=Klebsiella oxytoca TaxID=571 RepID=UPI000D526A11|nr:hypothetical protein [Klebsiella oxytoca]AWF35388.1 hypothetical protein CSC17_5316 [Klebsiella oxytoca]
MTNKLTITNHRLAEIHAECEERDPAIVEIRAMIEELQERRNAERDCEPVAWTSEAALTDVACEEASMIGQEGVVGSIPLYRHAQPAPVVYSNFEDFWSVYIHPLAQDDELKDFAWDIWNACRAAMLQELQKSAGDAGDAGGVQISRGCRSNENMRDMQAGNSPVIGIDLAAGPDRTVEVRYVAPPGYVMVPKEPTPEILAVINEAIKSMRGSAATYARVLAAAPQEASSESQ